MPCGILPCGINGKRTWLERRNLRSNGSCPRADGLTQHGYPMGRQDHLRDLHKSIGEAGTFSATLAVPIRCAVLTDGGNRKDRCHARPSIQLSQRGRWAEPTVLVRRVSDPIGDPICNQIAALVAVPIAAPLAAPIAAPLAAPIAALVGQPIVSRIGSLIGAEGAGRNAFRRVAVAHDQRPPHNGALRQRQSAGLQRWSYRSRLYRGGSLGASAAGCARVNPGPFWGYLRWQSHFQPRTSELTSRKPPPHRDETSVYHRGPALAAAVMLDRRCPIPGHA